MTQMESAFTDAASLGVTVVVAAGDNGSTDGVADGQQHADFPASAPHALGLRRHHADVEHLGSGVGRPALRRRSDRRRDQRSVRRCRRISQRRTFRRRPTPVAGWGGGCRTSPADADPNTGYSVRVDGQTIVLGGTSAVAPLWAALLARCNQALGTDVGFAHPKLYAALGTAAFHDITSGNNGAYSAGAGWDACTGLGSPDGTALLAALKS